MSEPDGVVAVLYLVGAVAAAAMIAHPARTQLSGGTPAQAGIARNPFAPSPASGPLTSCPSLTGR